MKQETLNAMRAWLDGETVEFMSSNGWLALTPHYDQTNEARFPDNLQYRIKPRTIRIGEYDVPAPVRAAPEAGTEYWMPHLTAETHVACHDWDGDAYDSKALNLRIVHLSREAAELHAKALISLTEVKS